MMALDVEFTTEQQEVIDAIVQWRGKNPAGDSQYITLGGVAGVGKTTVIAHIAEVLPGTAVMAPTGKAAHNLRLKGIDAQTAHSQLYIPKTDLGKSVRFTKRRTLPGVETIIMDESQMIDHVLKEDALSFGVPVVFVGDHGQLPPVGTNAGLMLDPMLRLETIHRQALDNPILRLAKAFREGRNVPHWTDQHGRLSILPRSEFWDELSPERQVIVGFNRTRHEVNRRMRRMLGLAGQTVAPGERIICLQNNRRWNVFNGQLMTVVDVAYEGRATIHLAVETDDGRSFTLPCLRDQFGRQLIDDFKSKQIVKADYAYALTAHKAMGSEWDAVLVLEEIAPSWDAKRWRYTVSTRAKERLVYCMREAVCPV
jgi:exodeoxyribonuclease V